MLNTSRGPVDSALAVDGLIRRGVDMLFTIGGDGTQRGGRELFLEAQKRGHPLAVVGIPKTIDNDVAYVSRTFGYFTAVEQACTIIDRAHREAHSVENGISVVKLMGRHSGFIAIGATIASQDANFCLIPEVPFVLDGPQGFLAALKNRRIWFPVVPLQRMNRATPNLRILARFCATVSMPIFARRKFRRCCATLIRATSFAVVPRTPRMPFFATCWRATPRTLHWRAKRALLLAYSTTGSFMCQLSCWLRRRNRLIPTGPNGRPFSPPRGNPPTSDDSGERLFLLCGSFDPCYVWGMTSLKFQFAALLCALVVLLGNGCEKKSGVEKFAEDSNNAAKKAGESVKDTANKAKDAVKDTAQKAVDAGKEGVQKATDWATNAANKTTTFATNAAAKVKETAKKAESATTNLVNDIKQKVQ
jgi:hypothetical protein